MIMPDQKTVYHVTSRTALDGFPFGDVEKDEMVKILKKLSKLYFTEILGFCVMGNHFHLLVRVFPDSYFTDDDIKERYIRYYGEDQAFSPEQIHGFRIKLASQSEFVKEIKQTFSRYYNKRHPGHPVGGAVQEPDCRRWRHVA
jgi:REP element-mobilizing transposase RayT